MATANYPSRIAPAITITQTNLRIVPTVRPFFRSFDLPGEGYPFDYNQESGVQAMTPLLVTHVSQDMAWVLVETADLSGWLPVQDIAWIDEDQIRRIENRPLVAVVRDEFPLLDTNGQFVLTARIGALFPVINESDRDYRIWIIKRNTDGRAVFEETVLTKQQAQSKPVPLTPQNLAQLGNQMMGQNYGWGDILGNRDCSSMLQDLMAPFGIWLPRNGNDQGRAGGYYFSLKHLSPEDKEKTIVQNGVPFLTLLWLKGHIMLYVGPSDTGQALVFHNIWGIRTRDLRGAEGRYILGKAMVTTLSPGRTVPFADPDGDILKRLEGMTMLMPRFY
ncbi:peptidase P60 [bacterium]|nr:peptidase P60 [bacterium]